MVLRPAGKIFSSGTSDKAATEEEDLLFLFVGGRNLQGIPAENWSNLRTVLKLTPGELRKDESGLVDIFVVVHGVRDLPYRSLEVPLLTLGTDHETDLTAGVSGDGSKGVLGDGEELTGCLFQLFDQWNVQPKTFTLGGDVTSRSEGIVEELEIRFLEEGSSGTDGVRGVGDDDIVRRGILGQELEAIPDKHDDLWVREQSGHVGEVFFRDTDYGLPVESVSH